MLGNKGYMLMAAIAVLLTGSCAHYSKFVEAPAYEKTAVPAFLVVGEVALEQRVPDQVIADKLPELLSLIGAKYGVTVVTDKTALPAGKNYALLNLWVKEQSYTMSLDEYNSIAAILSITAPESGKTLLRAVYSEESASSTKSFQVLYTVLEDLFKALASHVRGG